MSVQSLDGARRLAALGFTRVILARELTLSEIAGITAGCGIETETFVQDVYKRQDRVWCSRTPREPSA